MKTFLLFLLVVSSALSGVAQSGTNRSTQLDSPTEAVIRDLLGRQSQPRPSTRLFVDLNAVQAEFLTRFEEAPGFGDDRPNMSEFRRPAGQLTWNDASYSVLPPELIGLEVQPVAYLSTSLFRTPRRADFTNERRRSRLKTRPLTDFESNAVAQLKAGTNIVSGIQPARLLAGTQSQPEQLLVLAPIHAKADCAKCHKCEEGKLLGAFSYSLARIAAPTNSFNGPTPLPQAAPTPLAWLENHTNAVKGLAITAVTAR